MSAFIQLSKLGDILSILPVLQNEAEMNGGPVPLIVAREYAQVLEGVSYATAVIWEGDPTDVAGALVWAKRNFSGVTVLQTHGNMPVEQATPSFQLDQWRRARCINGFYSWPLVIDRRDEGREVHLSLQTIWNGQPGIQGYTMILFADHSQSSPFLHKEELARMLKEAFPDCTLVRLSEVRAERFYDLLGLYDLAAVLVTVETAHAHLSKASAVPTIVLAADGWRGTAWHPKFKLYMRYGAWERRKDKVIEAVAQILKHPTSNIELPTSKVVTGRHGYNLSICEHDTVVHECYRAHTNGDWKTRLFFDRELLRLPPMLEPYSHEDCRLFVLDGKLHGAYTVANSLDGRPSCYQAYGEIKGNEIGHVQVRYPGNDLLGMQKNWCPFVVDDQLHFIYGNNHINGTYEQIVLRVQGEQVVRAHASPAPEWEFGEIRGGAVVPHNGKLLRFFHSRVGDYHTGKYFIGAALMEAKAPFATLKVSSKPIIEGDERFTPGVRHWKKNVAICYGAVKTKDGKFLLSYGRNDCECCVATLEEKDLNF